MGEGQWESNVRTDKSSPFTCKKLLQYNLINVVNVFECVLNLDLEMSVSWIWIESSFWSQNSAAVFFNAQ